MRTGIQTKSMAPLTKAMQAATKEMPAGRLGNKRRTASTKDRPVLNWLELDGSAAPIREAASCMRCIAESERTPIRPGTAAEHSVPKEAVAALDDAELEAYCGKVRHALGNAMAAASSARSYSVNARENAEVVARAIAEIEASEAEVRKVFAERAEERARTAEAYKRAVEALKVQLGEAEAELERRTPRTAADMARELEDLRRDFEQLRKSR